MAGFGYKDYFKLISAKPRLNGRFYPNPRVEFGFCGFSSMVAGTKESPARAEGRGCPDLHNI